MAPEIAAHTLNVALAGNPNSGKTSVFNALTGLRHKVGNYPGVTVEHVVGSFQLDGRDALVTDLPGAYSLSARSEDERIARDVLLGHEPGVARPDILVIVVDASTLVRNLYFTTQLLETGVPTVVALNMIDVAEKAGRPVDAPALEAALGVPVVPVIARTGEGIDDLRAALPNARVASQHMQLPDAADAAMDAVVTVLASAAIVPGGSERSEALRLLTDADLDDPIIEQGGAPLRDAVVAGRDAMEAAGLDREALEAEHRYAFCMAAAKDVLTKPVQEGPGASERADRVLTHPVLGPVIFLVLMALIFQAVYEWAGPFMDLIEEGVGLVSGWVAGALGPGMLTDLLVGGVITGIGNVIIFLPQICILFLLLTILEDLGYLARAAFLIDRLMKGFGLQGKAFVPLMSSFACAIPGIMAARTIESRRDRMVTILVAPLMSCSARLPVYALMIGAFIPPAYQGLTLLGMYLLSIGVALVAAWVLRKTMFRGESSSFLLELPSYKLPTIGSVLRTVWMRGKVFVKEAGTIILAISIILWVLAYFPRNEAIAVQADMRIAAGEPEEEVELWRQAAQSEQSYAGRMGKAIEPVIEPLGFDWKIGVGLVASFAAREVLVSSLGIVYGVGEADEESIPLRERLQADTKPDGSPSFTWLTALSLMVFFVLASQCMSTLAIVKRETNSWRWPIFMFTYMTILAYVGSLIVYQGGRALGWG